MQELLESGARGGLGAGTVSDKGLAVQIWLKPSGWDAFDECRRAVAGVRIKKARLLDLGAGQTEALVHTLGELGEKVRFERTCGSLVAHLWLNVGSPLVVFRANFRWEMGEKEETLATQLRDFQDRQQRAQAAAIEELPSTLLKQSKIETKQRLQV